MNDIADHHIAKNDAAAMTPGAIWVSTWGYEAVICDFFIVTRCTGKSIWLAEIDVAYKNGNSWLADEATPKTPIEKIGAEKPPATVSETSATTPRRSAPGAAIPSTRITIINR